MTLDEIDALLSDPATLDSPEKIARLVEAIPSLVREVRDLRAQTSFSQLEPHTRTIEDYVRKQELDELRRLKSITAQICPRFGDPDHLLLGRGDWQVDLPIPVDQWLALPRLRLMIGLLNDKLDDSR